MKSRATASFWQGFYRLTPAMRRRAYLAYRLWRSNPFAHSLQFKRVNETRPIYSARIGLDHRAMGLLHGDTIFWFFIGRHDEYELQLRRR